MKDDGCILMIAAFGQGRDGMSHASCALRDAWRQKRIGFEAVDFFENGGAGVGVKASDKIKSTIRNRRIAKDLAKEATACYITPKLSPLGFLSCIPYFRLCRKNKLPYTLHFHGRALLGTYQKHILLRPAIKKWISCAHKNIALTPSLQKEMQQLLGGAGDWTAVGNFAGNDMMAWGAIEAAKERGLRVPEDIAVAGFDNVLYSSLVVPAMTTVHQPKFEAGQTAMRLLLEKIQKKSRRESVYTRKIELDSNLIVRESTLSRKIPEVN